MQEAKGGTCNRDIGIHLKLPSGAQPYGTANRIGNVITIRVCGAMKGRCEGSEMKQLSLFNDERNLFEKLCDLKYLKEGFKAVKRNGGDDHCGHDSHICPGNEPGYGQGQGTYPKRNASSSGENNRGY